MSHSFNINKYCQGSQYEIHKSFSERTNLFRLIMLIPFISIFSNTNLYSQDSILYQPVSLNCLNCTFSEALKIIESQTHFSFAFNAALFDENKKTPAYLINKPLYQVLD